MRSPTFLGAIVVSLGVRTVCAQGLCADAPIFPTPRRVVPDSAAYAHVGEVVTVEGCAVSLALYMDSLTQSSIPTGRAFLDFGASRPNQTFSAMVVGLGGDLAAWKGKRVRVTGLVQLVDGRPAILLTSPRQVRSTGWYLFPADTR